METGFAGRLAKAFIDSKLTPILVAASILLGAFAVLMLPREEEPQIKVPMIDVFVGMPGADAPEVENRVTIPMESLLWEIPGVEYVYSSSFDGGSIVTVRYKVGTDLESALIRLNQKLETNFDRIPRGVLRPLVKPKTIDDVPILALTLHSAQYSSNDLRRMAMELQAAIKSLPEVSEITVTGGEPRAVRVRLDSAKLLSKNLDASDILNVVKCANSRADMGSESFDNTEVLLRAGSYFEKVSDVANLLVGSYGGKPVYLRDVASIEDSAKDNSNYVLNFDKRGVENAVTLSIAKRPGANAVEIVEAALKKTDSVKSQILPAGVEISVSRDYGHTASEKSNELLLHMGIAVFGVAVLILIFLGWRESLVVLLAIPSTLALTLFVFYAYGYTLNRITLFALIFSIGILVDDAIVVVENIARHLKLPHAKGSTLSEIAVRAVDEVGNPTILATWAVIAAILPMAFVGGLMGPYMRPIPIGSTATMIFSLAIAFIVTPWAFIRVMRRRFERGGFASEGADEDSVPKDRFTRVYMFLMRPMIAHFAWRWVFIAGIVILLSASVSLVPFGFVKVKMLPFDNKSEMQAVIDLKEGATLEQTVFAASEMARALQALPEVKNMQVYAGAPAPFNFSGMVRHYFLRSAPNKADIQINLVGKSERDGQSHDAAKRVREILTPLAKKFDATLTVSEVPPGPPVLQTIVAEVYGQSDDKRIKFAQELAKIMSGVNGVVDIDELIEAPQTRVSFEADRHKALQASVSENRIKQVLAISADKAEADLMHLAGEREDMPIILEFDGAKPDASKIADVWVRPDIAAGAPVPLGEIVKAKESRISHTLYRKNLKPVAYVTADVAGETESPAYALFKINDALKKLDMRTYGNAQADIKIYNLDQPFDESDISVKWDGEWHITLEVFRDLGLAFAAVLVLIAMLMIGWFKSYVTPLVVMSAIPFSLIGILPAHWALGAFFTATSMIGFMAGAGIVVRNSIILVDFIQLRRAHGHSLEDSVVEAGAIRFRPMLLTALAVVVGASVILADPIFQGLAISLMFGEIASLFLSRMAVPVLYYMTAHFIETRKKRG